MLSRLPNGFSVYALAVLLNSLAENVEWHRIKLLFAFWLPKDAGRLYSEFTYFASAIGSITNDVAVGHWLKESIFGPGILRNNIRIRRFQDSA
jgi:hypothetical protein